MPTTHPAEAWPSDSGIEQLDGVSDVATGLPYIPKGAGPTSVPTYEVQYNRRQERLNKVLAPWRRLQVVDEGGLNIGVYPGSFTIGGGRKTFDGATNQAVPDNDTRFVYLDASAVLKIAASEPADLTSFLPLAQVDTAGGIMTLTDRRPLAALHVPQMDESSISSDDLDAALRAAIPSCSLQVGGEVSDNIDVTVQVNDAAGAPLAAVTLLRLWVGDADFGGECQTAPSGGISVQTGTLLTTVTANKHLLLLTGANGAAVL